MSPKGPTHVWIGVEKKVSKKKDCEAASRRFKISAEIQGWLLSTRETRRAQVSATAGRSPGPRFVWPVHRVLGAASDMGRSAFRVPRCV